MHSRNAGPKLRGRSWVKGNRSFTGATLLQDEGGLRLVSRIPHINRLAHSLILLAST
jgi:hypothetical protein